VADGNSSSSHNNNNDFIDASSRVLLVMQGIAIAKGKILMI